MTSVQEAVRAALLGVLQGATEFLPISSSGHLVIIPELLHWRPAGLTFEVAVHFATAVAVLIAFRRDWVQLAQGGIRGLRSGAPWRDPDAKLLIAIVLASVPAAIAGLLLEPYVESALSGSPRFAARFSGAMLLVTGSVLLISERVASRRAASRSLSATDLGLRGALFIGLAQALAIAPGISRSGATIAAGLALGLPRAEAARFSFLLATPIILGAGALRAFDLRGEPMTAGMPMELAIGAVAAFVVGLASIGWLMRLLRTRSLLGFALYTWIFGLVALWMLR